jgi:hypothetical protein
MDTIRSVIIGLPDRTHDLVLFKKNSKSPGDLEFFLLIFTYIFNFIIKLPILFKFIK